MPKRPENPEELVRLAAAVRDLRKERGLSQQELAAAAGVAVRRIQALEMGRLDPDYVLLVRVAKALGVRAGALVLRAEGRTNEGQAPPDSST